MFKFQIQRLVEHTKGLSVRESPLIQEIASVFLLLFVIKFVPKVSLKLRLAAEYKAGEPESRRK